MSTDDILEQEDWKKALDDVVRVSGLQSAKSLLRSVNKHFSYQSSLFLPTDYVNSWHHSEQNSYPGDKKVEEQLQAFLRWNATIMVLKAQLGGADLGGHISSYASSVLLYEVGFHHFWRADDNGRADCIYYQGHSSPGIYARSFLEHRFDEHHLDNFRRETAGKGLSSYPHPWLMPHYWEFPTVSMGLGPMQAIYQARLMKYLEARGHPQRAGRHVWCFCGDGEMDEPESLGALHLASREKLNNLIFVVNCNLQRLDGPVRGNGKIVCELEKYFKGASWHVIKALWDSQWDPILDQDLDSVLTDRLMQINDGNLQSYLRYGPSFMREELSKNSPNCAKFLAHYDNSTLASLGRAGHDLDKVYHAYKLAVEHEEGPCVILVQTVKGYVNTAHNTKKIDKKNLMIFRDRFNIPLTDNQVESLSYVRSEKKSELFEYLIEKRESLGGFLPKRTQKTPLSFDVEKKDIFSLFDKGVNGDKPLSTTMTFVRLFSQLLKDKNLKNKIVPIVADEARTFGMEGLFRQVGIYSSQGQQYRPVDYDQVMFYKESTQGQIFQEGLNEAGAMSSWMTAATSYSTHHVPLIPFYIYYSMFGFQRIGDLAWAAGDARAKGFLLGATAGRTTLHGEGLQHQDGHSLLLAQTIPNCRSYDPAFGYEIAAIIKHGLSVMEKEDVFYYLTLMNENYLQLPRPDVSDEDIIAGLYLLKNTKEPKIDLIGSGTILQEVLKAQKILKEDFDIEARVFSATSFSSLRNEALEKDFSATFNNKKVEKSHIELLLGSNTQLPVVAATDYMRLQPDMIRKWVKRPYYVLGTDGFGRSDSRENLREHFAISYVHIIWQSLMALKEQGLFEGDWKKIAKNLGLNFQKEIALVL
jgi:pyruvate dehydrogenase E1 component